METIAGSGGIKLGQENYQVKGLTGLPNEASLHNLVKLCLNKKYGLGIAQWLKTPVSWSRRLVFKPSIG